MARAALLQASPDALHSDREPRMPQPLFEAAIVPRRPDRQDAAVGERRAYGRQSFVAVQARVVPGGECFRAVVDVEEHGIEPPPARAQRRRDIADFDLYAPVLQW